MNDDADILELVRQIRELSAHIDRLDEQLTAVDSLRNSLRTSRNDFENRRYTLTQKMRQRAETAAIVNGYNLEGR